MQARGRGVEHQIDGKAGAAFLVAAQKYAVVVQHRFALDGKRTARQLIESGSGTVTPYGVVYDNGMKLEKVYDGRFFPCHYYEPNAITIAVTSKAEPEDTEHILITLPTRRQTLPCWTRFIKLSGAISETPIPPTPQGGQRRWKWPG